jgi:hypothetical protein
MKSTTSMTRIDRIAAGVGLAVVLVASGCAQDGAPEALGDLPGKTLRVQHDSVVSSGLVVKLDYGDLSRCSILDTDAVARLNGRPVPLVRGEYDVIPPMGGEGGWNCTHPSVTLDQIPSDLPPPWTIEIGDASETVSATFGPGTANPFQVGPLTNASLTSSQDNLNVPIAPATGEAMPTFAAVTSTASDGQSSVRAGWVYQSDIEIMKPVNPGWPPGPVTLQIVVYYYPLDVFLDCQNATCLVSPLLSGCTPVPSSLDQASCSSFPIDTGTSAITGETVCGGPSCSSLPTISATTTLSVELACQPVTGVCP